MSPRREMDRSWVWVGLVFAGLCMILASLTNCRTLRQETARCEAARIATDDVTKRCCPVPPETTTPAACLGLHDARQEAREAIQSSVKVLDADPSAPTLKRRLRAAVRALKSAYTALAASCR